MARGGRPNAADPRFDDVVYAIRQGKTEEVAALLLVIGLDAGDGYLRTALIWATFYGDVDILRWLLQQGADIDRQDRNGYCALHFAGQEKQLVCAALLLEHGASLELADRHGNTPLWTAIFNAKGDCQLVNLYLEHGANPDHVNIYQKSPRELMTTIGGFLIP